MEVSTEQTKMVVDALAVTTTACTLFGWLPPVTSAATLVWVCIRIWETKTVQGWRKKRHPTVTTSENPKDAS